MSLSKLFCNNHLLIAIIIPSQVSCSTRGLIPGGSLLLQCSLVSAYYVASKYLYSYGQIITLFVFVTDVSLLVGSL